MSEKSTGRSLVLEATDGVYKYALRGETGKKQYKSFGAFVRVFNEGRKGIDLQEFCQLTKQVFVNANQIIFFYTVGSTPVAEGKYFDRQAQLDQERAKVLDAQTKEQVAYLDEMAKLAHQNVMQNRTPATESNKPAKKRVKGA
jgi:hypothetical protein